MASEKKLILHHQTQTDLVSRAYSIQRVDDRGVPVGIVCLFDVPPDPSDNYKNEHAAARSIFTAVDRHADLVEALDGFVKNRRSIRTEEPFEGALERLFDLAESALSRARGQSAELARRQGGGE